MEYFENSPGEVFLSKIYIQLVCLIYFSITHISLDSSSYENSALFQS